MSRSYVFDGCILVNGSRVTSRVGVFLTDFEAVISDGEQNVRSRKKLYLHPFSIKMLRSANVEDMKRGIGYEFRGTKLGAYSEGPLGHPGDGEFDHRPIQEWRLLAKYTKDYLDLEIAGTTLEGVSGFINYPDPEYKMPLAPWAFYIQFAVPRDGLKAFLEMNDVGYRSLEERLNQC